MRLDRVHISLLYLKRLLSARPYTLIISGIVISLLLVYALSLPKRLFQDPYTTVLLDRDGQMLGARIAGDGQWRFPQGDSLPDNYIQALISYEDQYFYKHPGVNLFAIGRATIQNLRSRKVVSGGSTISMQVIRLSRKGKARNLLEKIQEVILATRLELRYSKKEILGLYAAHAPFGGNVVGIEAACWRYFGRGASSLSWAEAALLAVLPNNPALIHPGRNREALLNKRNRLLRKLQEKGYLDALSLELALAEPIPEQPLPLPSLAPQLLDRAIKEGHEEKSIVSSLHAYRQVQIENILLQHHRRLRENEIWNAAVLVLETQSGKVLAYVGNAREAGAKHDYQVDIIQAARSSGSILKPFLYAAMLDEGMLLPHRLLPDIPTVIDGFAPKNFNQGYAGAVPASEALVKSLNIPAVLMLREYRYERFHKLLQKVGITTLGRHPDHYGLSLILGGAETRLWDMAGAYASLGRVLEKYNDANTSFKYHQGDYHRPSWLWEEHLNPSRRNSNNGLLDAGAIWHSLEALTEVLRPDDQNGWQQFSGSQRIAWKTGTSYGHRDAWAIGINPEYTVAVWVGNANGEGRPGLTGVLTAAPLMFDVFDALPMAKSWFTPPKGTLHSSQVCKQSGYLAGPNCPEKVDLDITQAGKNSESCPYHQLLHVQQDEQYQVHAGCESLSRFQTKAWFILPPVMEYYFKNRNATYHPAPPMRPDCQGISLQFPMEIISPRKDAKIYIPTLLDGEKGEVAFQVAHKRPESRIYWHLNGEYLGSTIHQHEMGIFAQLGTHQLVLVDENGESLLREFEIIR